MIVIPLLFGPSIPMSPALQRKSLIVNDTEVIQKQHSGRLAGHFKPNSLSRRLLDSTLGFFPFELSDSNKL
jgi:hypothetical protein